MPERSQSLAVPSAWKSRQQAFAEWLSQKEGKTYRLPTEAEWEYVAKVNEPYAWGIKNLLTGAREWCRDWFGEYSSEDQIDPVGPWASFQLTPAA